MGIELNELRPPRGSIKKKKRKGRGPGSGIGKTAGRGQKGQKSRSGGAKPSTFEGGQMPLIRRLPKKGFSNPFKKEYDIINLKQLNRFEDNTEITPELLEDKGLISGKRPLKILGKGNLERKIIVKAHKFSNSAVEKIAARGGKAIQI